MATALSARRADAVAAGSLHSHAFQLRLRPVTRSALAHRAVTLFTGQWTDLPLEQVAAQAAAWGYDGLELACWGDHFDVAQAMQDGRRYTDRIRAILDDCGLQCYALGAHLVGHAVCDRIDERHRGILPAEVWGDGDPEGVRRRAARRVEDTARAAALFGVSLVTGCTGTPIWHLLYPFPPRTPGSIAAGYEDFATRWRPIVEVFETEGVRFALEVHPTDIAFDFETTHRALDAIGRHPAFGLNVDPSHLVHQFVDAAAYIEEFGDRVYHFHAKDARRRLNGRTSILNSYLDFGEPGRGWDFVSVGHGDVDFDAVFRALNAVAYNGPISVEWEDSGMERTWGAVDALQTVRRLAFPPADGKFDSSFTGSEADG
jgi:sugar phosphate isomerase/epimerase